MYVILNGIWQHVCNSAWLRESETEKDGYYPAPFAFLMKLTSLGRTWRWSIVLGTYSEVFMASVHGAKGKPLVLPSSSLTHTHTQMYTHQSNHVSFDPDEYFCPKKKWFPTVFFFFPVCVHAWLLQSCLTLCDPMGLSLPGSSVHRSLQARMLEWAAMPSYHT